MNGFTTSTSKAKLTDHIQSPDMRSLLIEFCLDKMHDDPQGYSFSEQVLMAANRRLSEELSELRKKVDELYSQPHKRQTYSGSTKPSFFGEQPELKEDQREEDSRSLKKNKMSDVD